MQVVNANIKSGSSFGSDMSAYGVRILGFSVVKITNSNVTAQPGNAGNNASQTAPGNANNGCDASNGGNASGPSSPGGGGKGGTSGEGGTGNDGTKGANKPLFRIWNNATTTV